MLNIQFHVILLFIFVSSFAFGQNNIKFKSGVYTFKTKYDTNKYSTTLSILKKNSTIFKKDYDDKIMDIKEYDLDNDGTNEILFDFYSGGAHCCTSLFLGKIVNGKFNFVDSVNWGNSFYAIHDFNDDGKKEILGANDMFAYAFTNFAQSEFNVLIYAFENNKFTDVTSRFPKIIEEEIKDHTDKLKPYLTAGFTCPENDTADTFNTDAGAVKAILAPIVADYYSLGDVKKGYSYVDLIYKCPDKEKFIKILQNDYKLK